MSKIVLSISTFKKIFRVNLLTSILSLFLLGIVGCGDSVEELQKKGKYICKQENSSLRYMYYSNRHRCPVAFCKNGAKWECINLLILPEE